MINNIIFITQVSFSDLLHLKRIIDYISVQVEDYSFNMAFTERVHKGEMLRKATE